MSNPVLVNQTIPESDVVPLTGRVGAEVRGVRLGGDLSDVAIAAINQLLLKYFYTYPAPTPSTRSSSSAARNISTR